MENLILRAFSQEARGFLAEYALRRPVATGEVLYADKMPFTHAVFPHTGIISLMGQRENGTLAEKAAIGNEGFLGLAVILGAGHSLSNSVVRVAGEVSYIPMSAMHEAGERFACYRLIMMRYAQSLVVQLMESVVSARLDQAEAQVVNWLLFANRRMHDSAFVLTQDSLAEVLGLRRVTVGGVWSKLKREGIISYSRGLLQIKDLRALEAYASESHGRTLDAFAWQVAPHET
ncbi:MAG: cAMP-responsive transcriptional regulator [Saliniramus fredricksonii]|uniref:cAMP-binding domain of CRP or a regulatory subunit of cAMP-dependent protein kinases n=1 Tax=Saliniramus fredricksonii TaxID=1653334 RepID=A0A0P8BRQ5_9HYPH|nr:Crp/Fnr family transcriptional regulator [Saliniramus fredricksonii]KPQ12296.1 MAG: cAMP-responsive transcriptional regulator [Saliniramus fredricksonii]SCC81199.1 cAMP-binding domain of CRP or a regulatory subunit of cAMP-dependent protein kinases [Saliniramus fredricksonii]